MEQALSWLDEENIISNEPFHLWEPETSWLQGLPDVATGAVYCMILVMLGNFAKKHPELRRQPGVLFFALFAALSGVIYFLSFYLDFSFRYWKSLALMMSSLFALAAIHLTFSRQATRFALSRMEIEGQEPSALADSLKNDLAEKSEQYSRLASLIEFGGDAIIAIDPDGIVTDWNRSAEKLYGYKKDEMLGKPLDEIVAPEHKQDHFELRAKLARGTPIKNHRTKRCTKNGKVIDVSLTISPFYNREKRFVGISAIARDISLQVRNEQNNQKTQKLLQTIFDAVPAGVALMNRDGVMLMTNPSLNKMLEYRLRELDGQYVDKVISDSAQALQCRHRIRHIDASKSVRFGGDNTFKVKTKRGTTVPVEVSLSPISFSDNTEIVATITDISNFMTVESNLRRERNLLRQVLDLNTDGWWDWDLKNLRNEYLSPGFKQLFGYEDHELSNEPNSWKQLIFPEDLKVSEKNFRLHLETDGRHPYYQKVRYRHKDGSTVWVICKGIAIKDENGEFARMVGIHFDITQLVNLDNRLQSTNVALREKNKELEQLVYTISHDLKSPIITCMSFLDFLKEDFAERKYDAVDDSINELKRGLRKLKDLISDLLELSHIEHFELEFEKVDVKTVLAGLAKELKDRESSRVVDITISDNLPVIRADKSKITQVFENLLTNAIKYGKPDSEVTISVSSKTDGESTYLCFEDNGIGIDKKYHDKIFELFQRLAKDKEGTGVGLTIVSRIMNLHGGETWVDSSLGAGAKFWLRFPLKNG